MSVTAIIVDDEQDAREVLFEYVNLFCPSVEVIGQAGSYQEAKELLTQKQADLLLLDISLDEKDTLQLLSEIGPLKSQVIFITAYKTFAFDAYNFGTIDYILKPIDIERFKISTARAISIIESKKFKDKITHKLIEEPIIKYGNKFALSTAEISMIIDPSTIMRIQGDGPYAHLIFSTQENLFSSKGLKKFDFLLDFDAFVKVHQSHIINLDYCKGLVVGEKNYLLTTDDQKVPVSRRMKPKVKAYFNSLEI